MGHAEIKRLFIDKEYQNKERSEDYVFIPAKIYDNEILIRNNPEYLERLENLPEELKQAHLHGNWDVFAGQYFKEFRREKHVIEPFTIPSEWKRYVSIDWGYNDYCDVLWHAVGYDRHIYTYRELHVKQMYVSDVARKILELTGNEKINLWIGSPDMWQTRGQKSALHGENIAEDFARFGIYWTKADNARIIGWTRLREHLNEAADRIPYLRIFSNCSNLIKCLPQLQHDVKNVEDVATEPHELTDGPDSLRYFIMSRPVLPVIQKSIITGNYTPSEIEDLKINKNSIIKNSISVSKKRRIR